MKTISARAKILYIIIAAFLVGVVLMSLSFVTPGDEYAMSTRNRHIYNGNVLVSGGRVLDKNGIVLTSTSDTGRVYNEDYTVRLSFLHTLGESGYIAGGVLENYSAELVGFNLLTGVFTAREKGGNDVKLTLDAELCAKAYRAMDGRKGAAGVYNYKTGEMVCMVSSPSYDPMDKPKDIDENEKYDGVYLNKFLYGQYVPGSTFKIVTAACAVEYSPDVLSRTFTCTGKYRAADGTVTCNDTHGTVTFQQAFNQSCNSVFAQLADELGKEKMQATAEKLGVSASLTVNRLHTAKGSYDVAEATRAELGWSGIGQHTNLVNPCNMMVLAGAVANGGVGVLPYYVDGVYTSDGVLIQDEKTSGTRTYMSVSTASVIKDLMRSTVTDYYGESYFPHMQMCAKTGTAEVGSDQRPHSWMVGFSLRDDFPYAFAVVLENAGSGYYNAGKTASDIMNALFDSLNLD